ncbi:MAG: restriction endonuclease subunit S, partial [Bryobacteraceae bacterium]
MSWREARLKYVARFGYGDALPPDEAQDGQFQVFGSNGSYASFTRPNTGAPAIIVGRKGSFGKMNWTPERCFASDTTFVVDATTCEENLRWVYWLLQTLRLDEFTEEAAIPGLNREVAYNKPVLVPTHGEQRAIADYLDSETARLDALIAAKERLLALLAEKRQAI